MQGRNLGALKHRPLDTTGCLWCLARCGLLGTLRLAWGCCGEGAGGLWLAGGAGRAVWGWALHSVHCAVFSSCVTALPGLTFLSPSLYCLCCGFRDVCPVTGFNKIVGNYLQSQPLTLLAFTDTAVSKLSARVVRQFRGAKLIKLLEMHMILNKFPADYFRKCLPTAFFDTALGDAVFKGKSTPSGGIVLSPTKDANPSRLAVITDENVCGNKYPTLIIQALDTVLIPPSLFNSATH